MYVTLFVKLNSHIWNQALTEHITILGAGFSGICMGIQLKRAGIHDFTIVEQSSGVGGTWRDNTYPGAACDVPSYLYSFSFETKKDWSLKFAEQPEILSYLEHCTDKFGLRSHLKLGTTLIKAEFNENSGCWELELRSNRDEGVERIQSRTLVCGAGQLNRPSTPEILGQDGFIGPQFHSARWDHSVDFKGKDIAVIGNGASAVQFVPPLAAEAKSLQVFQRSPNWIVPKADGRFEGLAANVLKITPANKLYRLFLYLKLELRFSTFQQESFLSRLAKKMMSKEMEVALAGDSELRDSLIPDYTPGCKRVLQSNDYLQTLMEEHVGVVTSPIEKILPQAVLTADGVEHNADVIVYGTGFKTNEFLNHIDIQGLNQKKLRDVWQDGAEAFLGINVSGFPNLYMTYGPNTNLGHNSIVFMIENQVQYILKCIQRTRRKKIKYLDLLPETQDQFNQWVQDTVSESVWATECSSWYKNAAGKVVNNWPASTLAYRWNTSAVNFNHYRSVY